MKKLSLLIAFLASLIAPTASRADDIPFREQRREVFRVTPVHEGDIVFLGNSITNFGVWPEMFGPGSGIVNRGISGIGSAEVAQHIDLIAEGKPAKLFIMLGINDYATPEVVVPSLRKIIAAMREESPLTEIYVQSVLPCNLAVRKATVAPMNEEIVSMCEELRVPYIDIYSLLADNGNPKGMLAAHTNDQLHVLASGYRLWTKELEKYVGRSTVWGTGSNVTINGLSTINNIRLSEYGMLPVNDGDILMLGDYNVMTAEWQEMLGNPQIKNRGFGQAWGYTLTIDHLQKVVPTIVKGNPESVFIQCGLKDLDGVAASAVSSLWTKYQAVVADVLNRAPNATVYVQSVIPSAMAANNSASIVPFNRKMKEYAAATGRVEFVDLYGALVDESTGALAARFQGANTRQSHGINGRAYLRWANLIAPLISNAVAPAEPTDEEFERSEAIYDAKAAIRSAEIGSEPGEKSQEALDELKAALEAALAGGTTEELRAAIEKFNSSMTMPKVSDENVSYWYKLSTPLRDGTYVNVKNGALGSSALSQSLDQQWKFVGRPDGALDIVNRSNSLYVTTNATYNVPIPLVSTSPAAGWTLAAAATPKLFIISSGTVQFNRHPNTTIVNWGGGSETADLGCQFKIEFADQEGEPDALTAVEVAESSNVEIFDLLGRRVENPAQRGIFIADGKKFIR